jgi:hypothetical protein
MDYYGNAVDLVAYPSGKSVGTITGLNKPNGLCSDDKGDVWVVNAGSSTIEEYSHTGAHLATLDDNGYEGTSCAYDPKTGNLAVGNYGSETSGPGNIAIYKGASGKPTMYGYAKLLDTYHVAYAGDTGTLYLDGADVSDHLLYASLMGEISRQSR